MTIHPSHGLEAYPRSLEHILAELERLDLLIRVQVWRARQRANGEEGMRALYIAEDEPEELLDRIVGAPPWVSVPLPSELLGTVQTRLDELSDVIAERTAASLEAGVHLRLVALETMFELERFDVDAVLVCLVPELDRRYGRLYGYLHDDITRQAPSVELILDLLCADVQTKVAARRRFSPAAPLRRYGLLQPGEELRLEPRITRFLFDDDDVDDGLRRCARLVDATLDLDRLVLPDAVRQQLELIIEQSPADGPDLVLYLQGAYGVGKQSVAAACSRAFGRPMLVVDGRWLAARGEEEFLAQLRLLDREARLQSAVVYWDKFDALLEEDRVFHLDAALSMLEARPAPSFLAGDVVWEPTNALHDAAFMRLQLPPPDYDERLRLWRMNLDINGVDLEAVASMFRLTGGQIRDAAASARSLARARQPATPHVTDADLRAACRLQSNPKLARLAQKLTPHYTWDDIVLPADQVAQLQEIANHVRYGAVVYEAWGFGTKLALGKGINVLFAGPPGTGKTMAADVLACTLGLDLYKIDLSTVVSKYIGETEKNLSRIFAEATTSNAVLFFDEADALFGKRTQVRDAHDRYANVEISYLLQKMEEYEGVVILATNLRQNIDHAFVRRLNFIVELPIPSAEDRHRIWSQIWPAAVPRDTDVDLGYLAERIEVAGGNIRNIALASAFLAAADGGTITMRHLARATEREYQKIGKVLTGREFENGRGSHHATEA